MGAFTTERRDRTRDREKALSGDRDKRRVWKWVVSLIVTTAMVALAAGMFAQASPPRYVSTASVLVGPVTSDVDTLRASQSLTSTYSQLLLRADALAQVSQEVGMTSKEISDDSDVTFNVDTRIVTLTVTTESADTSARIASTLTTQLTRLVGTVDPTAPGALSILSVQPQTAEPLERSVARYAALGGIGWLLLAIGVLAAFAARPGSERERERTGAVDTSVAAHAEPAYEPTPERRDAELIAEQVRQRVLRGSVAEDRGTAHG